MLPGVYLRRLHVEGVKLLRDLTLDFTRDGEVRNWTVLLGPNGLCKTTVLQLVGLLASGATYANRLANVPALSDRRAGAGGLVGASALFELEESAVVEAGRVHATQTISPGEKVVRGGSQPTPHYKEVEVDLWGHASNSPGPIEAIRGKDAAGCLVAAYGTVRVLPTPRSARAPSIRAVERVQTLFDQGELVGTDFAEILSAREEYVDTLRHALLDSGILPNVTDLQLTDGGEVSERHQFEVTVGGGAVSLPSAWLSQGYQSTISWIADLIGQFFLDAGGPIALEDMRGLVLIDELDLHLHPRWQVRLIPAIRKIFPNVQFIATTHSPMMLPELDADEVFILSQDPEGHVVAKHPDVTPKLMTASEIYRVFFGMEDLYPNDLARKLQRYGFLVGDASRTDEEEVEMLAIRDDLQREGVDPGWEPVARQPDDRFPEAFMQAGDGSEGAGGTPS